MLIEGNTQVLSIDIITLLGWAVTTDQRLTEPAPTYLLTRSPKP